VAVHRIGLALQTHKPERPPFGDSGMLRNVAIQSFSRGGFFMRYAVTLALICVFICAGAALAADDKDLNKGTILVGGGSTLGLLLGNHTIKPEEGDSMKVNSTIFDLTGFAGYFAMEGVEIGGIMSINYGTAKAKQGDTKINGTMTMWDIGPQAGYYYNPGKNTSYAPFGMLALEYLSAGMKSDYTLAGGDKVKNDADISGWSVTPRVGLLFFLNKKIAVDASLFVKYISASGSTKDGEKTDIDVTSTNYGLMFGIDGFLN
jgi:hypothetical protein